MLWAVLHVGLSGADMLLLVLWGAAGSLTLALGQALVGRP
jgi:hypothetical protein